jgi:hypothetical protein
LIRRRASAAATSSTSWPATEKVTMPLGGVQVQERWVEPVDEPVGHEQETGAARAPQELAAGGRQQVAADLGHVDRHLSDRLAGVQRQRVEGHVPGAGGVLDQGDLLAARAQQLGDGVVGVLERLPLGGGGLVAADGRLQAQMVDDRFRHRLGRQRGSRVVQMDDVPAAGGLRACPVDVKQQGSSSSVRDVGLLAC